MQGLFYCHNLKHGLLNCPPKNQNIEQGRFNCEKQAITDYSTVNESNNDYPIVKNRTGTVELSKNQTRTTNVLLSKIEQGLFYCQKSNTDYSTVKHQTRTMQLSEMKQGLFNCQKIKQGLFNRQKSNKNYSAGKI